MEKDHINQNLKNPSFIGNTFMSNVPDKITNMEPFTKFTMKLNKYLINTRLYSLDELNIQQS